MTLLTITFTKGEKQEATQQETVEEGCREPRHETLVFTLRSGRKSAVALSAAVRRSTALSYDSQSGPSSTNP